MVKEKEQQSLPTSLILFLQQINYYLKKELKKIAIDKDTSLSGLILDIITDYVDSGKESESSQEDSY